MPDNLLQQSPRVQIRVGDAERGPVLDMLQSAYGAGQFDIEEFNERQRSCLETRHVGDLSVFVAGLSGGTGWIQAVPNPARVSTVPVMAQDAKVMNTLAFVNGKATQLDPSMSLVSSFALWGGGEIRTEVVMGSEAEIEPTLSLTMGGHTAYIPPGIRAIDQSTNIMAEVSITEEADGDGSNGILVIKGFNFWGGTSVMLRNLER